MPPRDQNNPLSPNRPNNDVGPSTPSVRSVDVNPPQPMARPNAQFRSDGYHGEPAQPTVVQPPATPPMDSTIAPEPAGPTPVAQPTSLGGAVPGNETAPHMPGLGSTTTAPDLAAHKRKSAIFGIAILAVILVILLAVILMMGKR